MLNEGTSSRTDGVVRRLEQEILEGKRRPGDRLDERQLADHYGVSRTPVREALQRLAASGLVMARGRQGVQVAQLSVADLIDAFSVVAEMEALAANQAARRMLPEQRQGLEAAHRSCEAAAAAGDANAFYSANLDFHDAIANGSHNKVLQDELRRLVLKTTPYRRIITDQPGRMALSIPEHAAIMAAILRNDGPAAAKAMRDHVTLLGEGLSDFLHFLQHSRNALLVADTRPRLG